MRRVSIPDSVVRVIIFICFLAAVTAMSVNASPRITLKVQDTAVIVGQPINLHIYLDNPADSVAGFTFMVVMSRPDIAKFDYSGIGCDTSSTLASGAELIGVTDPSGAGTHLKFTCFYDDITNPAITPPLAPQTGGVAVILRINTFLTPFPLDDTLNIHIEPFLDFFSFSDPHGNSIGVVVDTVQDTTGFRCLSWMGSTCLQWERCIDFENCTDSISIQEEYVPYLDTAQVKLIGGRSFISLPTCDNNGDITVNILDLLCVVNYLFAEFNPSVCPSFQCDANASGGVNVVDLTYLVNYLFKGGPPPQ